MTEPANDAVEIIRIPGTVLDNAAYEAMSTITDEDIEGIVESWGRTVAPKYKFLIAAEEVYLPRYFMSPQLYKINNTEDVVVADDAQIKDGGSWLSSETLDAEDIEDLINEEMLLNEYDITEDLAADIIKFELVPQSEWAKLIAE